MLQFTYSVGEIADLLGAELRGTGNKIISRINAIEYASEGELSFLSSRKFARFLDNTRASCIIVRPDEPVPHVEGRDYIISDNPHTAVIYLINHIQSQKDILRKEIHSAAVVAPDVTMAANVVVSAGAVVSSGCRLGENVFIDCNVVLGNDVVIGRDTKVYANASIMDDSVIGERCLIHAGAVIGSDGFGYLENSDGSFTKIPQIGNVVIEDDVEIGACSCIDRAALGSTVLRSGVKIDNLVHIAHNVEIGEHTAIAAQSGLAGGVRIGNRNRIAGQAGVVGYISTADDVVIGAQSGVSKSITEKGQYSGSPAMELMKRLKQEALLRDLPSILKELKAESHRLEE